MSDNKRIFITGASAGFGQDTVKALAEQGHTVYATMRGVSGKNADKAKELTDWAKAGGHAVHVIEADVTSDASVSSAVARAAELGGIDIVINNAGVGTWGIDEGFTVDQAQAIYNVNLFGVMRVNRAVLPHMRAAGKGMIIYISSGLGRIIFPFLGIYTSSKFAIEAYAEASSYELAPLGIKTVIVQPGAYGTTFLANSVQPERDLGDYGKTVDMFTSFGGAFEERARSGNLGDPSEVVAALVEEVEHADVERPLRRVVGDDIKQGVEPINATCAQVQDNVLQHYGLK